MHRQRVVEVFRIIWVDGDGWDLAEVFAAGKVVCPHLGTEGVGLGGDALRKLGVEVIAAQDGQVLGHRRVGEAQDFGHGARGAHVTAFPGIETNDDLIFFLRDGLEACADGVADDDVARDPGIVGDDEPDQARAAQGARERNQCTFGNADDRTGAPVLVVAFAAVLVELDDDLVAVEGDAGILGFNVHGVARFLARLRRKDHAGGAALTE